MRRDGGKVVREVSINGTGKRCDETVTDFEHAEVNLHPHTHIEERNLHKCGELFHVRANGGNEETLAFNAEVPRKLPSDVPRIGDEETAQLVVHLAEDGAVVGVTRS